MENQNTSFNAKGQEVDVWGRIKYVSPTGVVSWYFESSAPTKAGYNKAPQTQEHRLRRGEAQRTSPVWDHYEELEKYWKYCDMPSGYQFGKLARIQFPHIEEIKTFRFDRMVKWFQESYEESMDLSNLLKSVENDRLQHSKFNYENVDETKILKPKEWWEDDDECTTIWCNR